MALFPLPKIVPAKIKQKRPICHSWKAKLLSRESFVMLSLQPFRVVGESETTEKLSCSRN